MAECPPDQMIHLTHEHADTGLVDWRSTDVEGRTGVFPRKKEREKKKGDRKYSIERTKVKGAERNAMDGLSLSPFYTNFSFFVCIFGSFEFLFFPLSLSSFY